MFLQIPVTQNMMRLAMLTLLAWPDQWALATQSQLPMRVGDCVVATTPVEFFYKDEGEYEKTHSIPEMTYGTLLNIDSDWNEPSSVEFLDPTTREPIVNGAVFFHQFARVPWKQGNIQAAKHPKCMSVKDSKDGYQPVVKMVPCGVHDSAKWLQQFSFNDDGCGARPIRLTDNPGKCVDAVHPNKVLLTDCSGVDSQKFTFRCYPHQNDMQFNRRLAEKQHEKFLLHRQRADLVLQEEDAVAAKHDKHAHHLHENILAVDSQISAVETQIQEHQQAPHQGECYILAMGGRKDMCLWFEQHRGDSDLQLRPCEEGMHHFMQVPLGALSSKQTRPNTVPTTNFVPAM
jgi:hypothetical protein